MTAESLTERVCAEPAGAARDAAFDHALVVHAVGSFGHAFIGHRDISSCCGGA